MTQNRSGPARAAAAWFVLPLLGASLGLAPGSPHALGRWGLASLGVAVVLAALRRQGCRGFPKGLLPWGVLVLAAVLVPLGSTPYLLAHVTTAVRWAVGLGLAWAVAATGGGARQGVGWLLALGAVEAGLALAQTWGLSWPRPPGTGFPLGAGGTFPNPNWAASLLAPLLPLAVHGALEATGRRRWQRMLVPALLAAGLVATRSRGGVVAAAIGLLAMVGAWVGPRVSARQRWVLGAGAVLALFAAGLTLWVHADRISGMGGRVFLWRAALRIAAEHPWTGVGLRGFVPAYPQAAAAVVAGDPGALLPLGIVGEAHNAFLQLAAEAGVPVALGFLGLTGFAALRALSARAGLPTAAGGALVAWAAHALVDPPLQTPVGFYLYWYLTGIALTVARASSPGRAVFSRAARWVALGLILTAGLNGGRLVVADVLWRRGVAARATGDRARGLEIVGRAAALAPESGSLRSFHAQLLAVQGEPERAVAELGAARGLWFSFHDRFLYGRLLRRTDGREAAMAYWQDLARAFPPLVRPHFELGRIYEETGRRDDAIREYRAVTASRQPTEAAEALRRVARKKLRRLGAGR